jgi:hypothetical protein
LSSLHSRLECENLTIKSLTADTNYYNYILLNNVALNNIWTNCCPYRLHNIHTLDTLARDTLRLAWCIGLDRPNLDNPSKDKALAPCCARHCQV